MPPLFFALCTYVRVCVHFFDPPPPLNMSHCYKHRERTLYYKRCHLRLFHTPHPPPPSPSSPAHSSWIVNTSMHATDQRRWGPCPDQPWGSVYLPLFKSPQPSMTDQWQISILTSNFIGSACGSTLNELWPKFGSEIKPILCSNLAVISGQIQNDPSILLTVGHQMSLYI